MLDSGSCFGDVPLLFVVLPYVMMSSFNCTERVVVRRSNAIFIPGRLEAIFVFCLLVSLPLRNLRFRLFQATALTQVTLWFVVSLLDLVRYSDVFVLKGNLKLHYVGNQDRNSGE